jgi:hypothetical protein
MRVFAGDESGRVLLWGMKRIKQTLYGSSGVFPLEVETPLLPLHEVRP